MARYRYRRGRRGYRRSTNTIMMKFQSFMDISTKADEMQIISVSAGGKELLNRLPAQFSAYKYYKIGNIAVKLVPASTLPVDPTGLSIASGDNLVDPRDQLTPGMMRITNGEDVLEDISGMTADDQHQLYNAMMLDPRWFKWMLQTGVKRHATPRYWQVGQLHQDKWPGSVINSPNILSNSVTGTSSFQVKTASTDTTSTSANIPGLYDYPLSSDRGLFQVGHRGVLGWLPTDGMSWINDEAMLSAPPEIEVMKIILPPAYKTKYYYRMYITETVYFREPIMMAAASDLYPFRPLDVFHIQHLPLAMDPREDISDVYSSVSDGQTGGNYGDN